MKRLVVTLLIVSALSLLTFTYWFLGKQPINKNDKSEKVFVVKQQENVRDIASSLKQQGLIKSTLVFFFTIKQMRLDDKIQAGDFRLSPSMDVLQIAQALTHGSIDVWVTIPEGKRATEIAEILKLKLPSFQSDWTDKLVSQEGYLFPDTYLFPTDATVTLIITTMENNFLTKYNQAIANTTTNKLSKSDTVILASIVEREGKNPTEMKQIASVLENRISIGMALQTDATIQYALGKGGRWWPTVTPFDLQTNSAYNTYKNAGLPPTPIANPGFNSLNAVLHPADTNFLFYFTDSKGITHFAKTLDEQNGNINKFTQ